MPIDPLELGDRFWHCISYYWICKQQAAACGVGAIDLGRQRIEGGAGIRKDPRDYIADFQKCARTLRGTNRDFFELYFVPSTSKPSLRRLADRVRRELRMSRNEIESREQKVAEAVGAILEERGLWPAQKYHNRRSVEERVGL
jgi:hypothetical protein